MRLQSLNGHFVDLHVAGYQFDSLVSKSSDPSWDANWLMVRGHVWDGVQSWRFCEPCLTTGEAQELALWLRRPPPSEGSAAEAHREVTLDFIEPDLSFTRTTASETTTLAVHFKHGSSPLPYGDDDDLEGEHTVLLTMPQAEISVAADIWDVELASFPMR